ncbi:unnamed protein product [Lota lota]
MAPSVGSLFHLQQKQSNSRNMDFNMKKLASGAGVFFTRAVQFTEEKLGQAERTEPDADFEHLVSRADATKLWTERIKEHHLLENRQLDLDTCKACLKKAAETKAARLCRCLWPAGGGGGAERRRGGHVADGGGAEARVLLDYDTADSSELSLYADQVRALRVCGSPM